MAFIASEQMSQVIIYQGRTLMWFHTFWGLIKVHYEHIHLQYSWYNRFKPLKV